MRAARKSVKLGREIVEQLNITYQCASGIKPFEKVVAENRIFRYPIFQGRREGVNIIKPFASEAPLAKKVLVEVRRRYGSMPVLPEKIRAKNDREALASEILIRGCKIP